MKLIRWICLVAFFSNCALAHTGVDSTKGFDHGFWHPLLGLDHLLAMLAVGFWAVQLEQHGFKKAMLFVPASFVAAMMLGGVIGIVGIQLPLVEMGIIASLLVFGLMLLLNWRMPVHTSAVMVALFALFHGHAHGAEMPENSSGLFYALGFGLATLGLHLAGIGLATLFTRVSPVVLRWLGGMITLGGILLGTGIL